MCRSLTPVSLLAAVAIALSACADGQPTAPDRSGPSVTGPAFDTATLPGECATEARAQGAIDSLLPQLFKPGAGKRGKAQGFNNVIVKARRDGDQSATEQGVQDLINFTLQSYFSGDLIGGQSSATQERVLKFIYLLYCSNNISPVPDLSGIFNAANTVFIRPTTPDTIVRDQLENTEAALRVQTGDVPDDLFGTFVSVVPTNDPLPTSLDWYGLTGYKSGAFEFVSNPAVTFDTPVRAAVCVQYDDAIVTDPTDLRLTHGIDPNNPPPPTPGNYIFGSIEILAPVDISVLGPLGCDPLSLPLSSLGGSLHRLSDFFLPEKLAALTTGGARGGDIKSLSPFAVVDTKLSATGTGPASPQAIPVGSTSISTPVSVTTKTRHPVVQVGGVNTGQTPIAGIGVDFSPAASFTPAAATTNAQGTAASSWTLVAGANNATATPALPFSFSPASINFSATAVQATSVSITTASPLPGGQTGVAYSLTFAATGGIGAPYTWALAAGSSLPAGLTLSEAGVLSGTPTGLGSFSFSIQATSGPATGTKSFALDIAPPPVVITTSSPLPNAILGVAYSRTFAATGGTGTYTWGVTGGSLPAGLTLSSGGALSGTATTIGTATFTVQAASGTVSASKSFSLSVTYPTGLTITFASAPSKQQCYVLNSTIVPAVAVRVSDQNGNPIAGVRVDLAAVTNNGANVAVSQPFALSGADGLAVFNALSINKTGGYSLNASTSTPWPAASVKSGKFNISPSCP